MPIYEYRCEKCDETFEVMQKMSDPTPDPCPKCGAPKSLERLISRSSFRLKGGGWYSDLYGSTKKDGGSGGGGGASAASGSEAPAATAPSSGSEKSAPASSSSSPSSSGGPSTPSGAGS